GAVSPEEGPRYAHDCHRPRSVRRRGARPRRAAACPRRRRGRCRAADGRRRPRRQPTLLTPVEGEGVVVLAQVRSYLFSRDGEEASVLEGGGRGVPARKLPVPLDRLAAAKGARLAEAVRPLRMALLVASFPCKAQLDER